MDFEIIQTNRLYLRKLTDKLYEDILLNCSNEDIEQYLNIGAEEISTEKDKAKKGFSTYNKSLVIFQLIDKNTNQIIGWCGFHTWYKDHRRAEIGYALNSDSNRSKGYMSEAIKPIIQYGFGTMNLNRIEAFIGPENYPSLKLIEKLGFKKEGQLRNHYFKNGKFEDSVVHSLLIDEFVK